MFRVLTTDEFDIWIGQQRNSDVSEITAAVRMLSEYGHRLSRPHADTLNGSKYANMKELRVRTEAAEFRIAFAFDPKRDVILLVAGDKRGVNERRFYRVLISRADALYAEHLRRLR
jgi:hypothetical protein